MPVCLSCGSWGLGPLCVPCRRRLGAGGVSLVAGIRVAYAFHHSGTGRALTHRLKYHGLVRAADVLARAMVPLLPTDAAVLVPLPRARVRRALYGVDPAQELARRVAAITSLPMRHLLAPGWWWPRHAAAGSFRRAPRFRLRARAQTGMVLVDDVVTSGATLLGAAATLDGGISALLAATSPGMMTTSKAPTASGRLRDSTVAWQGPVKDRP